MRRACPARACRARRALAGDEELVHAVLADHAEGLAEVAAEGLLGLVVVVLGAVAGVAEALEELEGVVDAPEAEGLDHDLLVVAGLDLLHLDVEDAEAAVVLGDRLDGVWPLEVEARFVLDVAGAGLAEGGEHGGLGEAHGVGDAVGQQRQEQNRRDDDRRQVSHGRLRVVVGRWLKGPAAALVREVSGLPSCVTASLRAARCF